MRALLPILLLTVVGCTGAPTAEADSENAIAARADDIRNQANAEIMKQVNDIDAAANAEAAGLANEPGNTQ